MSAALRDRAAEVADWFARRRAGSLSPEDEVTFQAWLNADPDNRTAISGVAWMI
jgi:transmembrane sensor